MRKGVPQSPWVSGKTPVRSVGLPLLLLFCPRPQKFSLWRAFLPLGKNYVSADLYILKKVVKYRERIFRVFGVNLCKVIVVKKMVSH